MSLSRSRAASHVVSPGALIDLLVGEAFSLRRGAVDRAWIAWLMDSIPGIGPPATFRNVCALEAMRDTAEFPEKVLRKVVTEKKRHG